MSKVLIIGCGGVASVAIHRMLPGARSVHRDLHRQPHQGKRWQASWPPSWPKTATKITTAQVDADKTEGSSPSSRLTGGRWSCSSPCLIRI